MTLKQLKWCTGTALEFYKYWNIAEEKRTAESEIQIVFFFLKDEIKEWR
jgi:hypothetical protein